MIVNPDLYERYRVVINGEKFLRGEDILQNQDNTISIKASASYPFRFLQPKRNTMISMSYGAYLRLLLSKKSRLSGPILRVAKVAQADANQAKPLVRSKADTL